MKRFVRLNEVQYAEDQDRIRRLKEKGFVEAPIAPVVEPADVEAETPVTVEKTKAKKTDSKTVKTAKE